MKRTENFKLTPFGIFKNLFATNKYSKGGKIKFIKYHFNSHKDHNPDCDILEGYIDEDTLITYGRYIKGSNEGAEFMEYYSGENYVPNSKKRSVSRKYDANEIPEKYKNAWQDLRTEYFSQYNEEGKEELALEEIARLIREGNTSGYEPSWEIKYDIHDEGVEMGDADYDHVAKMVEDGVKQGDLHISYMKNGKEEVSGGWWTLTINSFAKGGEVGSQKEIKKRLEYLRKELRAERISYGELAELQSLAKYIDPSDVELLQAAGVEEKASGGRVGGSTLYKFVTSKEKSLTDFLTQSQDGLSHSVHKGYIVAVKGKPSDYLQMRFVTSNPNIWKNKEGVIGYAPYPDNTIENVVIINEK